jgi:hypothetical protein
VFKNRGQHCGDIDLGGYLQYVVGTVSLVMDLHITHERWGSRTDPTLNGHLHYPNDLDKPLNEVAVDKIRKYHTDYDNNPPNVFSFMTTIPRTSGRLHSEFVRILFSQVYRETDHFFPDSGVQLAQIDRDHFHFRRTAFSSQFKAKTGSILTKVATLRLILNIDGSPILSKSHTHTSYSQTSLLLTPSLSLGVPVPLTAQCM